jgi:hypothetical protein
MMAPVDPAIARKNWRTLEPYHGLVYFAPEAAEQYAQLGVEGFGAYFNSRAAAMGEVAADVVVATFFNFRPAVVRDAVPRGWAAATASAWVEARLRGVDAALRGALGDDALASAEVRRAAELAGRAADAAAERGEGRPLAAAHAATARPDEPHLALWHAVTVLREHRGDGHVAALVDAGVDGCGALVQHAAAGEVPRAALQTTRGWTDDEWHAAVARLAERGWVGRDGSFTDVGRTVRQHIEDRTDAMAVEPWAAIGEDGSDELRALVRPLSKAIVAGGAFGRRSR